jgi:hypothetical protein
VISRADLALKNRLSGGLVSDRQVMRALRFLEARGHIAARGNGLIRPIVRRDGKLPLVTVRDAIGSRTTLGRACSKRVYALQERQYRVILLGSCFLYRLGLHSSTLLPDPCAWLLRVLDFCSRGAFALLRISSKLSPRILFGRPSLELPKQGFVFRLSLAGEFRGTNFVG